MADPFQPEDFGEVVFEPPAPLLRWVPGSERDTELAEDFAVRYETGPGDGLIVVPAGYVTNGPSVPDLARSFMAVTWLEWPASIVHDYQYETSRSGGVVEWTRKQADDLLYAGLVAAGSPRAWVYYQAVRTFGWQLWRDRKPDIGKPVPQPYTRG